MTRTRLPALNAMSEFQFVATIGPVFERSPWIAQRTFPKRPFDSIASLHERLVATARASDESEKLGLIRAHPDLVGRMVREGGLTRESTAEQRAAGLAALSADEVRQFDEYNAAYRERFGFPFIICARENKKDAILAAFPVRLENTREAEIDTALGEIYKIARLRLIDAVSE
ncbi:MAG: 2-oxo-4-hydroxy-4-carboxy-5-ureidoimidazoline decarboxylase [Planctomycetota bacterium]|nr:2-oxo-4-hydroxy-4-carboxy-5-ureidoimidazoline decarboxylase [Planctomycetota bacterium]